MSTEEETAKEVADLAVLEEFAKKLADSQENLPPELSALLRKHFWDLLSREKNWTEDDCHKYGNQQCHRCPNKECGDNTNPEFDMENPNYWAFEKPSGVKAKKIPIL